VCALTGEVVVDGGPVAGLHAMCAVLVGSSEGLVGLPVRTHDGSPRFAPMTTWLKGLITACVPCGRRAGHLWGVNLGPVVESGAARSTYG
jgi:hypothetical protein